MRWGLAGVLLVLSACANPSLAEPIEPTPQATQPAAPPAPEPAPPAPAISEAPLSPAAPAAPARTSPIACTNTATQGGAILCKTDPGSTLALDGKPMAVADKDGLAVIGLRRTQASPAVISFFEPPGVPISADRRDFRASINVAPRTDTLSTLTMECNKIAAQTPEEKRHAEVAWLKKDKALKIFSEPLAPIGIAKPVPDNFPLSSSFGATRTYVPKTKDCEPTTNVHNGTDIATPVGTEIRAPMAGTVILADPDLYYEGGCIFLDLGRGLVSVTMHMSRIDVKPGDKVAQGQLLGLSGSTGRVTGPHLHWAIKYRNVFSDDRGTDIWLDPVLMMGLQTPMVSAP
jgi:murein DD-endopeptidase MepM/ murein hydrolase activator NlpD